METSARKTILFVDDEPSILRSLERLFRRERSAWTMFFVESGEAALGLMEQHQFDVVVSDLRMPSMDGAELLRHVARIQPNAKRIVLSGYAEHVVVAAAREYCHHFLGKPCDSNELRVLLSA